MKECQKLLKNMESMKDDVVKSYFKNDIFEFHIKIVKFEKTIKDYIQCIKN